MRSFLRNAFAFGIFLQLRFFQNSTYIWLLFRSKFSKFTSDCVEWQVQLHTHRIFINLIEWLSCVLSHHVFELLDTFHFQKFANCNHFYHFQLRIVRLLHNNRCLSLESHFTGYFSTSDYIQRAYVTVTTFSQKTILKSSISNFSTRFLHRSVLNYIGNLF